MVVQEEMINGINVGRLKDKAVALKQNLNQAQFNFRIRNQWLDGGYNQTTVTDFFGEGNVHVHHQTFVLDADEPPLLLGEDRGANPVENLLHALASCLTSSLVYHAAIRGIRITAVESMLEGNIDIRGFMGLADEVRKGYRDIKVTFKVQSDAPKEKLEELARFSPVLDVISHGTRVEIDFE